MTQHRMFDFRNASRQHDRHTPGELRYIAVSTKFRNWRLQNDAKWREEEHPRDDDGKFAPIGGGGGGGGGSATSKPSRPALAASHKTGPCTHGRHHAHVSGDSAKGKPLTQELPASHETNAQVQYSPIKEPYKPQTPAQAGNNDKRRYYVIGRRSMDGYEGLFTDKPLMPKWVQHEQLIADDGVNIGKFADGCRADSKDQWEKYQYCETETRYNAELIEEAIRLYDLDIIDYLEKSDPWLVDPNGYGLWFQNCQTYVGQIVRIASYLAKKRGIPLLVE